MTTKELTQDDYTLSFPVEKMEVSAVGRMISIDEAVTVEYAWVKIDEPFTMEVKVESRDGWRHCTMQPASDSDDQTNLD